MYHENEEIQNNTLVDKNDNVLHEEFIFKDEIFHRLMEERNKCIRSILWTTEIIVQDKQSNDFIKLRKSVLDSVNEFYRKTYAVMNRFLV